MQNKYSLGSLAAVLVEEEGPDRHGERAQHFVVLAVEDTLLHHWGSTELTLVNCGSNGEATSHSGWLLLLSLLLSLCRRGNRLLCLLLLFSRHLIEALALKEVQCAVRRTRHLPN